MIKMIRQSDITKKQLYKVYQITYYELYITKNSEELCTETIYIKSNYSKIEDMKYILSKFMKDEYIDIKAIEFVENKVLSI